jgi:murein DD-endopeptidase MepM/ murein hydrolase activator NlpD
VTAASTRLLWLALAAGATALFGVVLGIVLLGADIRAAQCGAGDGALYAPSAEALADIPGNYLQLYEQAAAEYQLGGDGWSWLAAVGSIETDHGRLEAPGVTTGENSAGAGGPMQFLAETWRSYGVDGNGDGAADRYDPRDAIPGAARYLKASGAPRDWPRAVFAYNHAGWYVLDVTQRAAGYRGAAQANPDALPVNASGQRVADASTPSLPTQPPGPIVQTRADHQARSLGRWQDDNAIDIGVPSGTDVLAVDDGEIVKLSGSPTRGYSITLRTASNRFFYSPLQRVSVRLGEHVTAGHVLGTSGEANNAEQLHVAAQHGDPTSLWGNGADDQQTAPLGGCDDGATGPANLGQARMVRTPRAFATLPAWAMAGSRPPAEIDARILPDALWILRTCGLRVSAGRETGHLSHGDGTALDLVPADPSAGHAAWDDSALRCAHSIGWTESCAAAGVAPTCPLKPWVRFVAYNGYPNHGDPVHVGAKAHLHISWLASAQPSGGLAPPNEWVRVFPVPSSAEGGT